MVGAPPSQVEAGTEHGLGEPGDDSLLSAWQRALGACWGRSGMTVFGTRIPNGFAHTRCLWAPNVNARGVHFQRKGLNSPRGASGPASRTQHTGSHLSRWFLDWSHSTPVRVTDLVPWHFPWQVVRVNLRQPGKWYVETQPVLTMCW